MTTTTKTTKATRTSTAPLSSGDLGLDSVFEHIRDPLLVTDVAVRRVVLWNDEAVALFGYSAAELRELPLKQLVPEPLRDAFVSRLAAYVTGRRTRVVERREPIPTSIEAKDGQIIPVELRLSRVTGARRPGNFVLVNLRTEQRLHELESLYRADEPLYRSLRLDEILQGLVEAAADLLSADKTSVLTWDARHERLIARATHGFHAQTVQTMSYARGEGISTHVAESGKPIVVADVRADARIPKVISEGEGIRSLVSVPIKLGHEVFGVFNVNSMHPRVFSEHEQQVLLALAQRAALGIQNARLFEESERRRRESEALYYADAVLYRSLKLDDVLAALVEVVTDVLGADKAQVLVWDATHSHLVVGAQRGYKPETVARLAFQPGEGIAGRVAASGVTHMVEDALTDPRTAPRINAITANEGVRSYICVPIIVAGEVFGVFSVVYCEPRTFTEDDQRPLEALAQRAAVAVQNAELYARVQSAAALEERQRLARELHDAVTQNLFSASLIADVLPRLWERDPEQGRVRLDELRRLTRSALAEMRALLLELRPPE